MKTGEGPKTFPCTRLQKEEATSFFDKGPGSGPTLETDRSVGRFRLPPKLPEAPVHHPLQRLEEARMRRWCKGLMLATVAMMVVLTMLDQPLEISKDLRQELGIKHGTGIVALELKARQTVDAWQVADEREPRDWPRKRYAQINVGLDFAFLLIYSTALALACLLRIPVWKSRLGQRLAVLLAWGLWIAAALDAVENVALLMLLGGDGNPALPQVARFAAIPKFALVSAALLYLLMSLPIGWLRRLGAR